MGSKELGLGRDSDVTSEEWWEGSAPGSAGSEEVGEHSGPTGDGDVDDGNTSVADSSSQSSCQSLLAAISCRNSRTLPLDGGDRGTDDGARHSDGSDSSSSGSSATRCRSSASSSAISSVSGNVGGGATGRQSRSGTPAEGKNARTVCASAPVPLGKSVRSSDSAFVPGQLDRGEQPIGSRDGTGGGGGQRDLFSAGREKKPKISGFNFLLM